MARVNLAEAPLPQRAADAAMLNAALESMPYGFSIWDGDFRMLLWNARYLEMYSLPGEHFYPGMPLFEVCELTVGAGNHPGKTADDILEVYEQRLTTTIDPARTAVYEKSIRGRTIKSSYLRSPGLGWVVTHEDITERRRREDLLRVQNLRLDSALENMPCGFTIWDQDHRLMVWNRLFSAIYGVGEGSLKAGASLTDFLLVSVEAGNHAGRTASELDAEYRQRLAALPDDETLVCEETLASGRTIQTSYRRAPDRSWVAIYEDITEQKDFVNALKQREAEVKLQNMRLSAAVNNMSQGLCMFDSDQRLVICNDRYADIYGLPRELVQPGTTLQEILRNRIERGVHPKAGVQSYVDSRAELVKERRHAADTVELEDDRVISVLHHPMADGGWVATHQDITEQRRTEERIRHLARHDALTDLPNRILFRERMEDAMGHVARGDGVAVLFIDLDHFKTVNDLHGHGTGDAVLKSVAARLRDACRDSDVVARLGGDEFAILHGPRARPEGAAALANRIVKAMAEPFDVNGHHVLIGASVGIAIGPGDGADVETLMKNADLAVYRAKAEGRGAHHFFEPEMDKVLQQRLAMEVGLRRALTEGEFALAFQPLYSLDENRVCGFEALLRWNDPEHGLVMPERIVPVAEETGLIVPIGEWVLRRACAAAAEWPQPIRVAVNLSPVQFRNRHLTQHVVSALSAAGLNPDRLELEVTESVLLAENEATMKTLHQLRRLGVRISMDDFGTGYSSLSYLRSFPFDKIKIDRSFVRDLSSRDDSLAIVKAVIGLGRSLGIETTAEGVETEAQLELVRGEGCTEVQGYLFSPPMTEDSAATLAESLAGSAEAEAPVCLKTAS